MTEDPTWLHAGADQFVTVERDAGAIQPLLPPAGSAAP
jgi:hypothetical protein